MANKGPFSKFHFEKRIEKFISQFLPVAETAICSDLPITIAEKTINNPTKTDSHCPFIYFDDSL